MGPRSSRCSTAPRGREVVAARLNGKLVDLSRPIEDDATLEPVKADSPEGLDVLRHSTAHLMAQAVQSLYPGTQVTIGPTIEDGFFYDFAPPTPFTVDDLPKIEAKMRELAKADLKVERAEVARDEAIERFRAMGEQYKVEILSGIPDDRVSIYRQGDWMDLCRGPHVPSTGYIRAFKLTSVAGAYWRGDEHNAMLSRIYGTSFASKEALEEHLKLLELARSARPSQARARDGPVRVRSDIAGLAVLPAQGRDHLQRARRLHAPPVPALRLRRSRSRRRSSKTSCGIPRAIGTIFARTCS